MECLADGPVAGTRKASGIRFANEPTECRASEVRLGPGATILARSFSALVRILDVFIAAWN